MKLTSNSVNPTPEAEAARAPGHSGRLGDIAARLRAPGLAVSALALLPGALTVYFSFSAGGFFPGTQGLVAIVLALALALRITLADEPFAGFSRPLAVALAGIGLYAAWALASALWSDAPARALLEFDRALLYALTLALFGSLPRSSRQTAWCVRGVALGIVAVSVFALLSRVLPEVLPTATGFNPPRLSYPLTYWNALGLLTALGLVLSLHLSSSGREPVPIRIAAAASAPVLGATTLLTFSRGGIAVAILGLVVYVALGRPRVLASGLLATVPATVVAVAAAYGADLLAGPDPETADALAQGEDLALTVIACAAAGAAVRALLLPLDRRLIRSRPWPRLKRVGRVALAVTVAVLAAGAVLVFDLPDEVERQYDRFLASEFEENAPVRERLTNPGNTGRVDLWGVALDEFGEHPLLGNGAGTFQVLWARERPVLHTAVDAHSLYLETTAELGAVGLLLVGVAVVSILAGFTARMRTGVRSLHAALFAMGIAWALRAAIDWDWEMPAVTIWLFALGGMALAARRGGGRIPPPGRFSRVAIAVGVLALAVTPTLVFVSQARLDDAVAAFEEGDCESAIDAALGSSSTLGVRPEPFEILAYCDARLGLGRLSIQMMRNAVERDPENWEFQYGLALVTGAAGGDPRPAAEAALALNPLEPLTKQLVDRFESVGPKQWEREARSAPLPFDLGAG